MRDDGFAAYDARRERAAEIWIADSEWCEAALPPRRWVAPGYALRGAVTAIGGPPGALKSSLMVAWACALALGKPHGDFRPRAPGTVIIFNVEDDADEQRRRLSATLRQFDATPAGIAGKVICVGPAATGALFVLDDNGDITPTPLMERLRAIIAERGPDLLICDPFAHSADENANTPIRAVIASFRAIAAEFGMAVVLIHHTRKGALEPGDSDILRGGSSIIGGGRGILTLLPMREEDAEALGMPTDRKARRRFVRLDGAKANYSDLADALWYERVLYELDNGETVPAVVPWQPPDMWRELSPALANRILDDIDAGSGGGKHLYSAAAAAADRAAWRVVQRHLCSLTEPQCRRVINTWLRNGVLRRENYHDPDTRRDRQGVRANNAKRPG
jgi:hypothetical protein